MSKPLHLVDKRNKLYGVLAPEMSHQHFDNGYAKYKVTIKAVGDELTVFCGNGLVVYADSPKELPEDMGWNLICVRAHDMQPIYLDSTIESGLRVDGENEHIPRELRDVGWRLSQNYYCVIASEKDLINLQIKYTGQYYSERVI